MDEPDFAGLPEEGIFAFERGSRSAVDLDIDQLLHDAGRLVLLKALRAYLPGAVGDDEYLETLRGVGILKGDGLRAFVFVIGVRLERVGMKTEKR